MKRIGIIVLAAVAIAAFVSFCPGDITFLG